jgi:hypothetical protein
VILTAPNSWVTLASAPAQSARALIYVLLPFREWGIEKGAAADFIVIVVENAKVDVGSRPRGFVQLASTNPRIFSTQSAGLLNTVPKVAVGNFFMLSENAPCRRKLPLRRSAKTVSKRVLSIFSA